MRMVNVLTRLFLLTCACLPSLSASAGCADTTRQVSSAPLPTAFSYELRVLPGRIVSQDDATRSMLLSNQTYAVQAEAHYFPWARALRRHSATDSLYLREMVDYNLPYFSLAFRYTRNHSVRLHRSVAEEGTFCRLNDFYTLSATFNRPLYRGKMVGAGYYLGTGIGYATSTYDPHQHFNNEFIGTHLNIFFTAGAYVRLMLSPEWSVKAGIDFSHHSNGALKRPNKGVNVFSPFFSLVYHEGSTGRPGSVPYSQWIAVRFTPYWMLETTLGVGAKTLLEGWQNNQYKLKETDKDYHSRHLALYGAYTLQIDMLRRYAPRWASGIGVNVFYGDYVSRVAYLDAQSGHADEPHSPWSVALALKHQVYVGRFSARMGVGYYLYRHMGCTANQLEKPYFERIGVHYELPRMNGISLGFNVNAHALKADFTGLELAVPIKM